MERDKIIDFYINRLDDKNFELSMIHKELVQNDVDRDEIRSIVQVVENENKRRLYNKMNASKANNLLAIGGILTVFGGGITIATYTGIVNMGNSVLIAYGPFLSGVSIFLTGLSMKKKSAR